MTEPVKDYISLAVPAGADTDDPKIRKKLDDLAYLTVMGQYQRPPRAVLIEPVEWFFASHPDEVEQCQPAHDCDECRLGNIRAAEFLIENPGRVVALGNLTYTEVW